MSPVRHTRDGLIQNQFSKSLLIASIHHVLAEASSNHESVNSNSIKNLGISYFPAYEIMMDELRDYRYYDSMDLIHPNAAAIDIIFHRFLQKYCTAKTLEFVEQIHKIQVNLEHRTRFPESPSYQIHLQNCLHQISILEEKMEQKVSWETERVFILKQLDSNQTKKP